MKLKTLHCFIAIALILALPMAVEAKAGFPRGYTQIISESAVEDYPGVPFPVSPNHNDVDLSGDVWDGEPMAVFYVNWNPTPSEESSEFTLTLRDGTLISGNFTVVHTMLGPIVLSRTTTLNLGSETITYSGSPIDDYKISLYPVRYDADTSITGLVLYSKGLTITETDQFVFYECPVRYNPIITVYTENANIDAAIYGGPIGAYYKGEEHIDFWGNIGAIKNFVFDFFGNMYFFLMGVGYWFKLIFIDNFALLVSTYLLGSALIAALNANDIPSYIKALWKVQKDFVNVFMHFVRLVTEIIQSAKEIIFKWV